jgi:hypothetical protein
MRKPTSDELAFPPLRLPASIAPLWQWRHPIAAAALATAALAIALVILTPAGKNQPFIYMIF